MTVRVQCKGVGFPRLVALLALSLGACGPADSSESDTASSMGPEPLTLELTLDDGTNASGSAVVEQWESPASTTEDCVAGVSFSPGEAFGISAAHITFVEADPGATTVLLPVSQAYEIFPQSQIRWNPDDPEAFSATHVHRWHGTMVLQSVTDELVEIALQDGTHCEDEDAEGGIGCQEANGTLVLRGPRSGSFQASDGLWRGHQDVTSGQKVCSPWKISR